MEDRLIREAGAASAPALTPSAALALTALATILVVTAAWWALALWPAGADTPVWLERTREVCFGVTPGGLPHAGGWILLIGEPLGMLGFLIVVWGASVREGLETLARSRSGRAALATAVACTTLLVVAAALRVGALRGTDPRSGAPDVTAAMARAVDAPAPPLSLIDQHGDRVTLDGLRGRVVLVAFAYGHCTTVCPLVVQEAARAVRTLRDDAPVLLIVTLDPWRDTPGRLAGIAAGWGLPGDAHLLGGSIADVEAALDAWRIARGRNRNTGEIVHAAHVYLVDPAGTLAWVVPADARHITSLARGLGQGARDP